MKEFTDFDYEKYVKEQAAEILQRTQKFNDKLYLEFGGKILFDFHAAGVLPGYDPNIKMRLLQEMKETADLLLCIYAGDIERKKIIGGESPYQFPTDMGVNRAGFAIVNDKEAREASKQETILRTARHT